MGLLTAASRRLCAKKKLLARKKRLEGKYGLTEEQYLECLVKQGGVCAICGRSPLKRRLAVDHDHGSRRVRGLLCRNCNQFRVSISRDSDGDLHRRIADYLESTFDARQL